MSKTSTKFLISLLILLCILQAGLIFFAANKETEIPQNKILHKTEPAAEYSSESELKTETPLPVHYSYFSKKEFYDEAYDETLNQIVAADEKVYGGIIPHHLIVKDKIAAFFSGIEKYDYENIILIGPNHFSAGKSNIILSQARWETPYGTLEPNFDLINKLSAGSNIEESPFASEHSISGLVGFIKKSFPNAKFTPIILKSWASEKDCETLAKSIFENVNKEKTLVVATVDFSHYMPSAVADFHDLKSNAVIENFDYEKIFDLEIDSPPSIFTLLKYLELQNAQRSKLIFSTNSGKLTGQTDEPATSHNFFYFSNGEPKESSILNFLFFGDMMLDRSVGTRIQENGLDYLFEKLAGEENRFFQGIDLVGCNLEGAVTNDGTHYAPQMAYDFAFHPDLINRLKKYNFNFFTTANNHLTDQGKQGVNETMENLDEMDFYHSGCVDGGIDDCSSKVVEISGKKIGMAGFSTVYTTLNKEKLKTEIKNLADSTDLVIVNIHWGVEYTNHFNKTQQDLAHILIDAGADIIIGHHPHVVQGIEIYKNKPIFYSLGNFIFDQYFSKETQEGFAVGINIENEKISMFLYPFKSNLSQPDLMSGNEKEKFLKDLADWSEVGEEYIEEIKKGEMEL